MTIEEILTKKLADGKIVTLYDVMNNISWQLKRIADALDDKKKGGG